MQAILMAASQAVLAMHIDIRDIDQIFQAESTQRGGRFLVTANTVVLSLVQRPPTQPTIIMRRWSWARRVSLENGRVFSPTWLQKT